MSIKTGQYVVGPGEKAEIKRFENGKSYLVVPYYALNAGGIIGSEYNGVSIIDVDRHGVVTDRLVYNQSPEKRLDMVNKIMAMDWSEFANLCTTSKKYRGGFSDLENPENGPGEPNLTNQIMAGIDVQKNDEKDIRLDVSKKQEENADSEFFKCKTRSEMMTYLLRHSFHHIDNMYSPLAFSWDIKVYNFNETGDLGEENHYNINKDRNEEWAEYLKENENIFYQACSDALSVFTDYRIDKSLSWRPLGVDDTPQEFCDLEFSVTGRSGGHLVLTDWDGPGKITFNDRQEICDFIEELDDEKIAYLYHIVASVDASTTDQMIKNAMGHAYHYIRNNWEEENPVEKKPEI
jgi:hypothetical protein